MQHLPSDIFDVINTYTSVRSLKNTCTEYFKLLEAVPLDVKIRYSENQPISQVELVLRRHPYCLLHVDVSGSFISDASALGGVHTLNLNGTNVTYASALGGVHTLNLSYTPVTDVSALGGVHTLYLNCTKVTDVSALGGVHTLNLT